nr:hypothetical protein [Rhodospirillales bacterium]
ITVFDDYPLEELRAYIDWSPFFQTWEMHGHYPAILADESLGAEATRLFRDAERMLADIVARRLLRARAVIGLFPANSNDQDDIEVYADESRSTELATVHCLRQQDEKPPGRPNRALADFVAPRETGLRDYLGAFVVTAGIGVEELVRQYQNDHDDYSAIMVKAIADRLAEAFAERLHERVRKEFWGYAAGESLGNEDLIREGYRGIRPAPGYPACPDHTEKETLFRLVDGPRNTGVHLTESFAMWPAAAVSGFYFSHPASQYFAVGKIGRDQAEDYARRKGMALAQVERWLAPYLAYEP